jgi:chromosomal replication initiation ATPase DnaA
MNARELEEYFQKIADHVIPGCKVVVKPGLLSDEDRMLIIKIVTKAVCSAFGIKEISLRSNVREGVLPKARQCACYYLRMNAQLTYAKIAEELNYKSHDLALYSYNKWLERLRDCEPEIIEKDNLVRSLIKDSGL